MSITSGGAFTWTPSEAQGGASYPVTITVTDNGTPNLSHAETFNIRSEERHVGKELNAIGTKNVNEQALLSFSEKATDKDLPAQTHTYSLNEATGAHARRIN